MRKLNEFLVYLKAWRRTIMWVLQIAVFAFSAVAGFLLRFDFTLPQMYLRYLEYAFPIWIVVKIVVFRVGNSIGGCGSTCL